MFQRSFASRMWHASLALGIFISFAIQINLLITGNFDVNSGSSTQTVDMTTRFVRLFSYFTIQSNIFVLVVSLALVMNPRRDGPLWRVVRLDSLLGIAVTGIVFVTVLAQIVHLEGAGQVANAGFHYFSPVMALLGWLAFGPRGQLHFDAIYKALIWPLLWVTYILLQGVFTHWYPYPFIDVVELGYARVALNILGVLLLAIAIGYAIVRLDQRLSRQADS